MPNLPSDVQLLVADLMQNREAAVKLYSSLQDAVLPPLDKGKWSPAQHFQHLALFNQAYLGAMRVAVKTGRPLGQERRNATGPGWAGRLLIRFTEPPVQAWTRAHSPAAARPGVCSLLESFQAFLDSHDSVAAFHTENWRLDLGRIHFHNPFVKGLNFSLITCLCLIAAHERRHFWDMTYKANFSVTK